jgi:hypothetical protein
MKAAAMADPARAGGQPDLSDGLFSAVAARLVGAPVTVTTRPLREQVNGCAWHDAAHGRQIALAPHLEGAERLRVLTHEIGHLVLAHVAPAQHTTPPRGRVTAAYPPGWWDLEDAADTWTTEHLAAVHAAIRNELLCRLEALEHGE